MKYFTYIKNIEPEYEIIINKNKLLLGDDFVVFREHIYTIMGGNDIRYESDIFRLMFLRDNPTYVWVDADAYVLKPIDFKLEKVGMLCRRSFYDIAVMIGNGESDVYDDMLKNAEGKVGFAQNWAYRNRDRVARIPEGYFNHRGLYSTTRRNK